MYRQQQKKSLKKQPFLAVTLLRQHCSIHLCARHMHTNLNPDTDPQLRSFQWKWTKLNDSFYEGATEAERRGAVDEGGVNPPFDRRSGPKPNTDGYWSGPLQLLKLRVRVLGCNAEDGGNALTRPARLNEIQGEFCCSSAEQSLARQYSYPSVGRSLMNVSSP